MADDDLLIQPDYVFEEEIKYNTAISRFENGSEQRRSLWAAPAHKFKLTFNNRTESEKDDVLELYNEMLGAYGTFLWTNPNDSVQYTVRFDEDSFALKNKAYGIYDFSVNLIQVK